MVTTACFSGLDDQVRFAGLAIAFSCKSNLIQSIFA